MAEKVIASNRRARHDYEVLETHEAGVALQGTEVKSLRAGHITFKDSFVDTRAGQLIWVGGHISPYEQGNIYNHPPERDRKLLMHKREIMRLSSQIAEKGLTLVPLRLYFKHGIVKIEIGLCRGKKAHDKRATLREREMQREADRYVGKDRD